MRAGKYAPKGAYVGLAWHSFLALAPSTRLMSSDPGPTEKVQPLPASMVWASMPVPYRTHPVRSARRCCNSYAAQTPPARLSQLALHSVPVRLELTNLFGTMLPESWHAPTPIFLNARGMLLALALPATHTIDTHISNFNTLATFYHVGIDEHAWEANCSTKQDMRSKGGIRRDNGGVPVASMQWHWPVSAKSFPISW